jgi:hypothetical protein
LQNKRNIWDRRTELTLNPGVTSWDKPLIKTMVFEINEQTLGELSGKTNNRYNKDITKAIPFGWLIIFGTLYNSF